MGRIGIGVGWAIVLLLPTCLFAQFDSSAVPTDIHALRPLDLHQGCWQVRLHTSNGVSLPHATADTYRAIYPNYSAKQLAEVVAQVNAEVDKQEAGLKKGSDQVVVQCPLTWDYVIPHLAADPRCAKTFESTGTALHQHVVCTKPDGHTKSAEKNVDVELTDPEHLKGSIDTIYHTNQPSRSTISFVAKYLSDIGPHAAKPTTDLAGVKPKGAHAVSTLDPDRLVVSIHGQTLTAAQAATYLDSEGLYGCGARNSTKTATLLRDIYMHKAIADEALALHLDERAPWRDRFKSNGIDPGGLTKIPNPPVTAADQCRYEAQRELILWDAYFGQSATESGKQELLRQAQERYRITVLDPDFFIDVPEDAATK